jgi:hypothetical protein
MDTRDFRFKQRRTYVTGKIPDPSGLLDGELYAQVADGTIYFKDVQGSGLHTVITDASGFGLNKIKFSGASSGQFPLWDGAKFIPYGTGEFVTSGQTGQFITTGQTGQFITTGQTGQFVTTGQVSGLGGNGILSSGYGLNSVQQTGSNNNASGNYSLTIGSGNLASADFSYAFGNQAKTSSFGEFAFSNGSFSELGDSQYSFVMGRATTMNSAPTNILINNSDKIVELELGSTVFFTINVVGMGGGNYISNEIKGVVKRSDSDGSTISFLESPSKSIFVKYPNNSNFLVNPIVSTLDNSLKIECVGHATIDMVWFAKIDLVKIKKQPKYKNIYFDLRTSPYWYDLGNWYLDSSYSIPSNSIPKSNSIVYMHSQYDVPEVYIDDLTWVTPHIIYTTGIASISGLILRSDIGKDFTGIIIGNSTFIGANPNYAVNLNTLNPNEISLLSPELISSLTLSQISSLSPESISALTPQQLAALSPEQLSALTNLQVQGLFESNIDGYASPTNPENPNEEPPTLQFPSSEIIDLINSTLNDESADYLTIDGLEEP